MRKMPRAIIFSFLAALGLLTSGQALAQRVVSIGGTVTEIVYLLGAQDQLVASDTSSIYPTAANQMPKVGYQRSLSVEGVLSVHPDKVLITPASGPAKVLQQLKETGITLVNIQAPDTKQGIFDKVAQVAAALNEEKKGQVAIKRLEEAFNKISVPASWKQKPPRLLFVLQMGGAPMVAGSGTAPDALFNMAGAKNAAASIQGYKTLTPEALITAQPDVIVVSTQGQSRAGNDAIWSLPGISSTPAGQSHRLVTLDALLALGLGPRTPQAITLIHQQLAGW